MRKLTLQEYANENKIHINTARIRFNKWLIDWAFRNKLGKVVIFETKTQDDLDLEEYNKIFHDKIKEEARIKKEITDYNNGIVPVVAIQKEPKAPAYIPKEKKKHREIVPSLLEWDALDKENQDRCKEFKLVFSEVLHKCRIHSLSFPGDITGYLDAYEFGLQWGTKLSVEKYAKRLSDEFDEEERRKAAASGTTYVEEVKPEAKGPSILDKCIRLAEKHNLDYDLIKHAFDNTKCPQIHNDEAILEYLEKSPKEDYRDYARNMESINVEKNLPWIREYAMKKEEEKRKERENRAESR